MYTLTVHAEGYPDRQLTMEGYYFDHSDSERNIIKIMGQLTSLIEAKPAIKALPEPRGGYA